MIKGAHTMIAAENFAGRGRAENTQFPARFKIDFFRKKIVKTSSAYKIADAAYTAFVIVVSIFTAASA